ncbi:MAG: CHAT domain-containing protein, partial [Planctomycetes bacterium]|nr:CHAT domain-containing protein [Planctomycetota bacterium]
MPQLFFRARSTAIHLAWSRPEKPLPGLRFWYNTPTFPRAGRASVTRPDLRLRVAPMILQIRHLPDTDPAQFQVLHPDPKNIQMGPVTDKVPNPVGYPVAGWPDMFLLPGLTWYLEKFLDYPFEPEMTHAQLVQMALRQWGEEAFEALFGGRSAGRWFDQATEQTYAGLDLQIVSNDPAVLAWPWEALYDRQAGCRLAQTCQVERRLDHLREPPPLGQLPKDRVNILLVIARPYERDVRFRSVARALVEWAARPEVPAHVHILRPPTLDRLRAHLREQPNFYHLLHFDGHGSYGDGRLPTSGSHTFQGPVQGRLIFEKDDGSPDPVTAEKLSDLLREHAVPAVVLNACQSAMLDRRAGDPFASVAAALLRAGIRSVTAMAYALYVSGAQQFLPALYQRLFEHGRLADAVRAGRQQMRSRPERVCVRGTFPLDDWLVPVLYQQEPWNFAFVKKAPPKERAPRPLPEEARDDRNPYGFLGRDSALLDLERALRRPSAGILIHGLGGVGKTTLARGFLHWLAQTGGLGDGVFWFGFGDIHSAEYALNRLGETLFGGSFAARPLADKLSALTEACRQRRLLVVWDNFESARGVAGTTVSGNLPSADGDLLREFLTRLRGGLTKVLITSRSIEDWLGATNRYLLPLGGLDGEERWEFANTILQDLGKKIDRSDKEFAELMNLLNGHPLAMRVLLPRLEHSSASNLARALRENLEALKPNTTDENEARMWATLRFATDALPSEWQPLLIPIAQHESFLNANLLEFMAQQVDGRWTRATIDACLGALANAGLLRSVAPGLYEMYPAVMGFLRASFRSGLDETTQEAWLKAFVAVMAQAAQLSTPKALDEQRNVFTLYGGTFHSARALAARLNMDLPYAVFTQALAAFAENSFNFPVAERFLQELADRGRQIGKDEFTAQAFH